jgi:hypothetical protein
MIKARYSTNYVGTIRASNGDDMFVLKGIRAAVSNLNKQMPMARPFYVKLAGRLGKNSPFAEFYKTPRYGCGDASRYSSINLKHCATADVYIYRR